ncbi:MAG: hypothetical protein FJ026_06185 [Chloroflexi bacterium]|nr:hypothetical protein [Chloroflexota bacterium]
MPRGKNTARQRGSWLLWGALAWLMLWTMGCKPYTSDLDVVQERLDLATPPIDDSHSILQSFVCQRPNLYEIELLPAVHGPSEQGIWHLILRSAAPEHRELARQSVDVALVQHNEPLHFAFSPQEDSAGKHYELLVEGTPGVNAGFWYSSVEAYGTGELLLDGHPCGDLRFVTRCRFGLPQVLQELASLRQELWLSVPLTMLLLLPGFLICHCLHLTQTQDPIADLACSLGISLATVPVALLWSTVFGLRWQRSGCLLASGLLAVLALATLLRTRFKAFSPWTAPRNRLLVLGAAGLFGLTLALRFVQIRNLVLPAWVDSPQHVLIAQLVSIQGQVPRSYEPLLPVSSFFYHFGFHAEAAVFHWLSGLEIPQAMLILGQVLNAASALMSYLLTLRLSGRRLAALSAAFLVGLVFYMPAYYVSWGRYTQLMGLLMLAGAVPIGLDWLESERPNWRQLVAASLMLAGLVMTHARVTVFGACFLLAYLLCESFLKPGAEGPPAPGRRWKLWRHTLLLALVVLGLSGPWLVRVITGIRDTVRAAGGILIGDPAYNAVPADLLFVARNRELMALALLGVLCGLLRRKRETLWIVGWCILVALVVNPGWLGLPNTNLVNNATAVIALFLPLALLGGEAIACLWDLGVGYMGTAMEQLGTCPIARPQVMLAVLFTVFGLWSAWGMVSLVNPATELATAEDLAAISWIEEETPADAVFLINARYWQLGVFVGTDGGYWVSPLTGRRTLLPPVSYVQGPPEYAQHINDMARIVAEIKDGDDPQLLQILEKEQVTHVYVGTRGGPLTPQILLHSASYRPVYCSGAVWVFEVNR